MENAAVDSKKRDQRKDHNKSNKGYHGYNKNKDKDRRDRDRRPSGKKNGAEKSESRKVEVEAKTTSEAVVNGAVASEEATEATAVEAMKEPELDEEEKERRRMQEEEQRRQDEITTLQEFIDEVKRKNEWKATLRAANQNVESRPEESDLHKLDSSLKKNTAFIRKLKNFTDGQRDVVKKEMSSLNLTKYIGEVAAALVEAKLKTTDLAAALEICSFLHQRYAEFSEQLMENWQKALSFKKEGDGGGKAVSNPSKLRVDLRFYADLVSVGIFTLKEGLPLLGRVLTELVHLDREEHAHAAIVLTFCKNCGDDYAGLVPRKMTTLAERHSYDIPASPMLPPDKHKGVRMLLKEYYKTASKHLVTQYRELQNTERANRRILLTKGELHEERKQKAEALRVSYTKLLTNTEQLADMLDEDVPDLTLEDKKVEGEEEEVAEMEAQVEESALGELWEDEDQKAFYENLTDLKAIVPGILYKDSAKEQVAIKEEKLDEDDAADDAEIIEGAGAEATAAQFDLGNEESAPPFLEDEPEEQEPVTSAKMVFDAYVSKLPSCVGRELIDSAAVDFCMSMNTKNNRKKLVKALFNVQRSRLDLLPFYSRLVATLYPCMPEVAVDLSGYLKQDFRYQVRKKDQMKVEAKNKVCRFIGEMVKFGMFAKGEALFCMKMLLFDFSHHHIEMACTLMETCGRFLYRTPDSHTRAKTYLEAMMKKKTALSMDSRYSMMIENTYYIANPPESPAITVITRPPLHEYIRKLLFNDLSKNTTEKVLKQIRKLDWSDPEVASYAIGCISAVWNIKYYNVRFAASLLAGLASHHDWIASRVVDEILEDIRTEMEMNDPRRNQRRISGVKYLAELYNYRLVDSSVIFKVLYSFLTFGALGPEPGAPNPFDPPDHTLRLRLICVMLDTCAIYFSSGSSKRKLDYFFAYFQRYYWLKRAHPMFTDPDGEESKAFPVFVTHTIYETLTALRPKMKLCDSLGEALFGVEKIEKEVLASLAEKNPGLAKNLRGTTTIKQQPTNAAPPPGGGGLDAIAEEGDEEQVFSGRKSAAGTHDSDDEDSNSNSRSRSQSQRDEHHFDFEDEDDSEDSDDDEDDDDEDDDNEDGTDDSDDDDDEDDDDEADDVVSEEDDDDDLIEEGMEDLLVPSAPKHIECEEDDEFKAMFDKLLNENITESRAAAVPKAQQMNAPMHSKVKKNYEQLQGAELAEDTVQFSVLLRKNNKPAYKEVAVPRESDIARNLQMQEEVDRLEKERVKQLTLAINDIQEEEDFNESLAAMQRPTLVNMNRRRPQHQHQKGVPEGLDSMFGAGPKRQAPR